MAANRKLLILAGDGIGPEVMRQVRRIIDWLESRRRVSFDVEEGLVGGAAYDATGTPLPDETLDAALASDAILFGAVGGPKWDGLEFALRPERGLLRLRKELDLFANLRPAVAFEALVDAADADAAALVSLVDADDALAAAAVALAAAWSALVEAWVICPVVGPLVRLSPVEFQTSTLSASGSGMTSMLVVGEVSASLAVRPRSSLNCWASMTARS